MTGLAPSVAAELERRLPGAVEQEVALAGLTTYHLGGPVAVLVHVGTTADLAQVGEVVQEHAVPVLVVGRGSNLLVADRGFPGIGIVLEDEFDRLALPPTPPIEGTDAPGVVAAGAAVPLPVVARRTAGAGWAGLEFFVGIPGSVGGAVRMNAGGHGRTTAEVLVAARVVDLMGTGVEEVRPVAALGLGYRRSELGATDVVTGGEFTVTAAAAADCEAVIAEIVRWRREHQPGGANAGSVFSNPEGDSAGRIIDSLGLKGLRVGGAVVSEKHANFFQAEPGASADDVYRLVREVQRRVADATGVVLEPELRLVGFDPDGAARSRGER